MDKSGKSSGNDGHGSSQDGNGRHKMTSEAASRIQSSADQNPNSSSATSGFKERAQSSGAKNQNSSK